MEKNVKILSINISEKKGESKKNINEVFLKKGGIENDAHFNTKNREISFLDIESIKRFENLTNRKIYFGEFAENITTEGLNYKSIQPLDILYNDMVEILITQIGKTCHGNTCNIFKLVGKCIVPEEGLFGRILKEGIIKVGDLLYVKKKKFKIGVLTLSDRAYNKMYEDKSGPKIIELLNLFFKENNYLSEIDYKVIPDNEILLEGMINKYIENSYDLIFTTGGTGIGSKDITINVISKNLTKEIPGLMNEIRHKSAKINKNALISRSIAGTINKTLIFCLPGNLKSITEYFEEIKKHLLHLIYMVNDLDIH